MSTSALLSISDEIHFRAVEVSTRYKRTEAELISVLQQADENRVFLTRGHSSLFQYVVQELKLSESHAYSLITVARKGARGARAKTQLEIGAMTLSNARRITAVLTPENQENWIRKACELSNRALEKEIVKVRPQEATPERVSYAAVDRVRVEFGLSERQMLRLRRVQDLLSQSKHRPISIEEAISTLTSEFLGRHDPVEKAKRQKVKMGDMTRVSKLPSVTVGKLVTSKGPQESDATPFIRVPIPAGVLHEINLRDERRCTQTLSNGSRCNQSRWVEIHHKIPVSQGGANTLDNLVTLCSTHHKFRHL